MIGMHEYIGPVFTIKNPRYKLIDCEKTVEPSCLNDKCFAYHLFLGKNTKFCPHCGHKAGPYSYMTERYFNVTDIYSEDRVGKYVQLLEKDAVDLRFIPRFERHKTNYCYSAMHFIKLSCPSYECEDNLVEHHDEHDFCFVCGQKLNASIQTNVDLFFTDELASVQKLYITNDPRLHIDDVIHHPAFDKLLIDFKATDEAKRIVRELEKIYGTGTVIIDNRHLNLELV